MPHFMKTLILLWTVADGRVWLAARRRESGKLRVNENDFVIESIEYLSKSNKVQRLSNKDPSLRRSLVSWMVVVKVQKFNKNVFIPFESNNVTRLKAQSEKFAPRARQIKAAPRGGLRQKVQTEIE